MPTYDYECRKCGQVFERFHSMTATPRVRCPECRGGTKKLMGTGAGIIFKGSGFYETDYRRKSGKPPASKESESKSDKTESTASPKTEDNKGSGSKESSD
jgi:putative FmdB family regulatory protein